MKIKKLFSTVLSCSLIVGGLTVGSNTKVKAFSDVVTNVDDNVVSIGNDYISREFSIKNKAILTSSILNKRIDLNLQPQSGSEDFVINTIASNDSGKDDEDIITNDPEWIYTDSLPTDGWSATLKNDSQTFPQAQTDTLFDDNLDTYVDYYQISGYPFTLDINLDILDVY